MMTIRKNTATVVISACDNQKGQSDIGVHEEWRQVHQDESGRHQDAGTQGPVALWRVCCMKPVQPASSKIWMNKKGSKTSGKNSVNRSGGSATPSIDAIAKTATLRANPSEIAWKSVV